MGIKENTEAGQLADLAFAELGDGHPERFWVRMIELCNQKLPEKKQVEFTDPKDKKPMNDIAARAFEKTTIPFGAHKGAHVGQVDTDYLAFLVEENEFTKGLRRYVGSSRFKQRVKEGN